MEGKEKMAVSDPMDITRLKTYERNRSPLKKNWKKR